MTKRMLIDSTHAEETRVVVLDGNRLEHFDVETSTRQHLKGNIYLAKIVRVEPSLQAAFVEFGGGRHGFLAFGEIHPDYYQIPVADRKRLIEMQEAEAREEEEEEEREAARQQNAPAIEVEPPVGSEDEPTPEPASEPAGADAATEAGYARRADPDMVPDMVPGPDQVAQPAAIAQEIVVAPEEAQALFADPAEPLPPVTETDPLPGADLAPEAAEAVPPEPMEEAPLIAEALAGHEQAAPAAAGGAGETESGPAAEAEQPEAGQPEVETVHSAEPPEALGDDADNEDRGSRRETPRFLRNYKIQEVMRRRQILLVQVVKEERGNKGAALTTYISLAGRFSVLMPNSPRGGGISRKITSMADRRRLKEVTTELDLPRGMGLIIRTAGANRPKPEIIRDCEYLLNQWDQIRDLTMNSIAPTLIYEEANLIKRAIRDVYSRDVDDILVDGEAGWKAARDFMRMLMPTHAKKVQLWREQQPLFAKAQVEDQLDSMLQPAVQLRSGGYLVINQTEALVAIDVNSGRSTRERGIEETALRTNLEAAEEAARQLRLRDLAGLIVIDFIDMESRRNNAAVEKRLKDALKQDRARIQVGSISHFGLLEMSRQRLRPSLAETSFMPCPHCGGSGHVRGTESSALHVLRAIEEEGGKRRSAEIVVHVAGSIALYILNHKRVRLAEIEQRFGLQVTFEADDALLPPDMRIERVRAQALTDAPAPISQLAPPEPFEDPDEELAPEPVEASEADTQDEAEADRPGETAEEGEQRRKRRRRRRRGRRDEAGADAAADDTQPDEQGEAEAPDDAPDEEPADPAGQPADDGLTVAEDADRKRRGRRGGRRRRRGEPQPGDEAEPPRDTPQQDRPPVYNVPIYTGPTPADPFGGSNAFDFFDAVEQAEQTPAVRPVAVDEPPAHGQPPSERPEAAERELDPGHPIDAVPGEREQAEPASVADEPQPEPAGTATAGDEPQPEPIGTAISADELQPEPAGTATAGNEPQLEPAGTANASDEPQLEPAGTASAEEPETPRANPAVMPVLIGEAIAAPVEKKRGWWRR